MVSCVNGAGAPFSQGAAPIWSLGTKQQNIPYQAINN